MAEEKELSINLYIGMRDCGSEGYVFAERAFVYTGLHGVTGTIGYESSRTQQVEHIMDDTDLWKMAVAGDSTTLGLDEFNEQIAYDWDASIDFVNDELARQAGFDQSNEDSFLEDQEGGRIFPIDEEGYTFDIAEGRENLYKAIVEFEAVNTPADIMRCWDALEEAVKEVNDIVIEEMGKEQE